MLDLIRLILFLIGPLTFLLVSGIFLYNNPRNRVNHLFALAFFSCSFYFIFIGFFILPEFNFFNLSLDLAAFFGLVFVTIAMCLFGLTAIFIETGSLKDYPFELTKIVLSMVIGVISAWIVIHSLEDLILLIIGFIGLNIAFLYNAFKFILTMYRVGKETTDSALKQKLHSWIVSFSMFNILSAVGWGLALFVPLPPEFLPLPPTIATIISSVLMLRSLLIKTGSSIKT
ncbi:MAG: hypothetical protein ACFFBD_30475 [Candidatus Hodarchaeota archaeon]